MLMINIKKLGYTSSVAKKKLVTFNLIDFSISHLVNFGYGVLLISYIVENGPWPTVPSRMQVFKVVK